jgi:hypothetical protein
VTSNKIMLIREHYTRHEGEPSNHKVEDPGSVNYPGTRKGCQDNSQTLSRGSNVECPISFLL